jgi:hypothetical protein
MASIYDKASLVLIPSGTKTSKVYSQKPVNGDGDFTFSRSTAATRVNADGNIEKETQNLLLQSNSFDTTWITSDTSVTSGQSGYDGTNDAWLLDITAATGFQTLRQTISNSGAQTFSIYAKAGTLDWIRFSFTGGTGPTNYYDISNGALGSVGEGVAEIEDVGNGWYRCSAFFSGSFTQVRIYPATANNNANQSSGNIYIQDAQLEQGLVARDYIETTTAAVEGGITDNVPRLDYTDSSCPALLLEPQRRNLVRHSEYIGGLEVGHTPTISIESVTNPEGYSFAYKVVAVSTSSRVQDNIGTQGNNMVFSGFFKGTGTATRLRFRNNQGAQVQYNIDSSGDFSLQFEDAANDNYGIEDYGNGWHRIYFETTTESAADNYIQVYPDSENGTGSVYVWGLQVEDNGAGGGSSYATSYIPTYGTSVTRNADTGLINSATDLIGQTEGTLFLDVEFDGDESALYPPFINIDTDSSNRFGILRHPNDKIHIYMITGGVSQFTTDTTQTSGRVKIALAYANNDVAVYVNGTSLFTSSSINVPATSKIGLNRFGYATALSTKSSIGNAMLFKTRLSNEELAALTTI